MRDGRGTRRDENPVSERAPIVNILIILYVLIHFSTLGKGCKAMVRLDLLVPDLTMSDAFGATNKRIQYSGVNGIILSILIYLLNR